MLKHLVQRLKAQNIQIMSTVIKMFSLNNKATNIILKMFYADDNVRTVYGDEIAGLYVVCNTRVVTCY